MHHTTTTANITTARSISDDDDSDLDSDEIDSLMVSRHCDWCGAVVIVPRRVPRGVGGDDSESQGARQQRRQ